MNTNLRMCSRVVPLLALGGLLCPLARAFVPTLQTALNPDVGRPYQRYGQAVAVEGNLMAVGAPGYWLDPAEPASLGCGAVFVYERTPAGWREVQRLMAPEPAVGDQFGKSVSLSEGVLAVGAPNAVGANGRIHLFVRTGSVFHHAEVLDSGTSQPGYYFGDPVVVRGDWLAAGAVGDASAGAGTGAVHVFRRTADGWSSATVLWAPDAQEYANFGWAIDVDDGRVAVGAPGQTVFADTGMTYWYAGQVYLFAWASGAWILEQQFAAPEPQDWAAFGNAVALRGGVLAAGAPFHSGAMPYCGAVALYERTGNAWQPGPWLVPSDADVYGNFGYAVALGASTVFIGAPGDSLVGQTALSGAGSVYVYERALSGWAFASEVATSNRQPNERQGVALGFDGRSLAVGAPFALGVDCGPSCADWGVAYVLEANRAPVVDLSQVPGRVEFHTGVGAEVDLRAVVTDPDGDATSASWREGGLELGTTPELRVLLTAGLHRLEFVAGDGRSETSATVEVEVVRTNAAPDAVVRPASMVVDATDAFGARVTLDGSASTDSDGDALTYTWTEGGQLVASGVVAEVLLTPGVHTVVLTVSDGALSDTATLTVTVSEKVGAGNQPPVANASATAERWIAVDGKIAVGSLDGSRSKDPEGGALGFSWFRGGELVAKGAVAKVQLATGVHALRLEVRDSAGAVDEDQVTVRVVTATQAIRVLSLKVQAAELPRGKKSAATALLRAAEHALQRGQTRAGLHQLWVFEVVLQSGRANQEVVKPLIKEARWIREALRVN